MKKQEYEMMESSKTERNNEVPETNSEGDFLAEAVSWCKNDRRGFAAAEISEEQADQWMQGCEGSTPEDIWDPHWLQGWQELLKREKWHFLLLLWGEHEEKRLLFLSDTKRVRPLEFLDYLIPDFGLTHGDAECATVRVSSVFLKLQMEERGTGQTIQYLMERSDEYFDGCDWIVAEEYGRAHGEEMRAWPFYQKKRIAWAYVRTTDIAASGKRMEIRSLENESGLTLEASEHTYIMIGCRGEIYDIRREKFEASYEATQEPLDVFHPMMDFLPQLQLLPEQQYVSIDEYAHLCYPRAGSGVYARQLEKRSKIFRTADGQEYFLGRAGDYMAVRPDDPTDLYVIQEDIFAQSYELCPKNRTDISS